MFGKFSSITLIIMHSRFRGCLLGLACGDAVGVSVEFKPRGTFPPVTGMTGGGPFGLKPGQWTDDTSMALCLAISLLKCKGFDARDQMERYCRWADEGYLSSTGECFDIGNTTKAALDRFKKTGEPFSGPAHARSAGNGSIMRLAPVPMFYHRSLDATLTYSAESSRTTHGAPACLDACRLLGAMIHKALHGRPKDEILFGPHFPDRVRFKLAKKVQDIADGRYRDKRASRISGTGYVVDSLEAALWCFHRTDSFEAAVLAAANLGDDADTTAAVCGQLAGAFYGEDGIPKAWKRQLAQYEMIIELADKLNSHDDH